MEDKHATEQERAGEDAGPIAGVFTVALFAAGMLALLYIFWPMIGAKSGDPMRAEQPSATLQKATPSPQ